MARKSPSGKQAKTESITLRIVPKTKYGLDLLARRQHRTLTSVIEWIVSRSFEHGDLADVAAVLEQTWSPHESDRVMYLAKWWPQYLSYEEELLFDFIVSTPDFCVAGPQGKTVIMVKPLAQFSPKVQHERLRAFEPEDRAVNLELTRKAWAYVKDHVERGAPFPYDKLRDMKRELDSYESPRAKPN
jgi:hypothetical protein